MWSIPQAASSVMILSMKAAVSQSVRTVYGEVAQTQYAERVHAAVPSPGLLEHMWNE
jgi:hypothetical protein